VHVAQVSTLVLCCRHDDMSALDEAVPGRKLGTEDASKSTSDLTSTTSGRDPGWSMPAVVISVQVRSIHHRGAMLKPAVGRP